MGELKAILCAAVAIQMVCVLCAESTAPTLQNICAKFNISELLPAMENITLPANYAITVRHTDFHTNSTSLVMESKFGPYFRVRKISGNKETNLLTGPNLTALYNDSWCAVPKAEEMPIIYTLPKEFAEMVDFRGVSLAELIAELFKKKLTQPVGINVVTVGGIVANEEIICHNTSDNKTTVQIKVMLAADKALPPYSSPRVRNPVALGLRISTFNASSDNTTLSDVSFDIVELDISKGDDEFSLPRGVYCDGMPQESLSITIPESFEASFDYENVSAKAIDRVDLHYIGEERIISFKLNASLDRDFPLVSNVPVTKDNELLNVIHDFKYGWEYRVDESGVCKVSPIDPNFGDVMLNSSTGEVDLKTPGELFALLKKEKYYRAGKLHSKKGPSVNVFVSRVPSTKGYTVVEALFFDDAWVSQAAPGCPLYSVVQYHKNESGAETGRSVVRIRSLKDAAKTGKPWSSISIYPCLKLVDKSYLYVNLKDASMAWIEKVGVARVQGALGEAIANTANISVLRISEFYFMGIEKDVVLAFFVIGEKFGGTPSNSTKRQEEISVLDAVSNLNKTLMEGDIPVTISGASPIKMSRSSLGQVPPQWSPSPPAQVGYTGGSMFVLAVFMLLLGAGIGVGGMFFMWKRQRLAGLAYQVFE